MNKHTVHQLILDKLRVDLDIAERAAQTAYETATHEENIAENKYDTLGLEASYLAAGQARRVEEIRQSLALCQNLPLRAYDEQRGIEIGALLGLEDEKGREQWLFLAPDAAGLKVDLVGATDYRHHPALTAGQKPAGQVRRRRGGDSGGGRSATVCCHRGDLTGCPANAAGPLYQ